MKPRTAPRALLPAALFLAAAALVVAITWPWALNWRGAFFDHWDPPFHAWRLEFMARRILAGDVFLSSGNTNMLYPHSGTLYYEALQYPPALFAAALFGLTSMPPELVYHVTLLVFWALSAPCMYFLLRSADCSRPAAAFGALAFCVAPWRISYAPEFQMELVFAMPLVFAFLVRFLRDRNPADAALCALSWWLLAVSELYEAVFAALAVPFVVAAFLVREPRMLRERRFWLGTSAGAAAGAASLFVLLRPYLVQHAAGSVTRPLREVARHAAQPLSYLLPYGRLSFWDVPAVEDELSLYPTLAVLGLSAAAAVLFARRLFAARNRIRNRIAFAAAVAFAVPFAAATAAAAAGADPGRFWSAAAVATLPAGFLPLALADRNESPRSAFLRGMAAAAALCFLLSLGPELAAGRGDPLTAANPVYLFCRQRLLPFLNGFRVVSRFGVVVLFALICLASSALDAALRRLRRPSSRIAAAALAVLAVAAEAVPGRGPAPAFRPIEPMRESPSVVRLLAENPERTIVDFPLGADRRWADAMRKFALVKDGWPCAFAWGGYFPEWASRIQALYRKGDLESLRAELSKLYPDALLLLDLHPEKEWATPAVCDRESFRPGWWESVPDGPALPEDFEPIATLRDSDGRFAWMDLAPQKPEPVCSKIFRSDLARARPVCVATVRTVPGTPVEARFNGAAAAVSTAGADGVAAFRFDTEGLAPLERAAPNAVVFSSADAAPCEVASFSLVPKSPTNQHP